ncbi:endonuclease/exonuclease/phosphatase family protein [Mycolicibacterium neoaurum]|uniref:endonuclease/exonuclease/phosphatase family protein n=1 Tax=Mycolicibacterium neoaurum TaxID=1795 RepID=UPI002672C54E|nr:endonuclease/exonuclease/phosphatase family protein [Mycolicibacterium neoaurum]MDO3399373.1 endonuclease/exonuclease/phosphatase family protein [Mycolicibacterium neoaurum]
MKRVWPSVLRRTTSMPVRRFDSGWTRAADRHGGGADLDRLSLATYNIWFNGLFARQRYEAIAAILAAEAPDVMVFQEVTEPALTVLLAQPWVRAHYSSAAVCGGRLGHYGMLLLSRIPVDRVSYTRLPSNLSRGYLTARYTIGGRAFTVVGLHLESGKAAAAVRDRQLRLVVDSVRSHADVAIMGDFNLRDAENAILPADFADVWPMLRPDEPGFTEDTTINHMRYDMKDKHRHVRFDRVLLKADTWTAHSVQLLGREPVAPELPRIFPSDHFGVQCTLKRVSRETR